jgi:ABC-2 type transport system ATP-binding protein
MPDFFGVYEDLTVKEYLHFFAAAYRIERARRNGIIHDVLELTDLTHKLDAQVDSLSRGMKQRLALARVLLHDPDLLLLEEPASGLDPRARIEVRELLKALKDMGKTILISSHILHELAQLCTRIGIIEAGKMVAQGTLDDIYRQLQLMRIVHVQLGRRSDDILDQVRAIPGVTSVEPQVDRLAIRLHESETSIEELHDRLHAIGAGIRMFQPEAMDMETAFMKLTEGKTA